MRSISNSIRHRFPRSYGWLKSQCQRFFSKKQEENYPIDFVVTWVDGSDIEWQRSKALYAEKEKKIDEQSNSAARYRDWDLMRYWFRAVEENAPWVRKVFFVTCGQKPEWLNLDSEKLVFITHDEFIPPQYLPTFNSGTIELNLWRIPDLSEHFVYFNDDQFINRPLLPSDFFENGLPKLCALAIPFRFHKKRENQWWLRTLLNDIGVINDTFDIWEVTRTYPEKFFSYIYSRENQYNYRISEDQYLTGMYHNHSVQIFLKSVFSEIWEQEFSILDRTCLFKFRNETRVNIFLVTLWQIFKGSFVPVEKNYFGGYVQLKGDCMPLVNEALQSDSRIVCLNDNEEMDLESEETIHQFREKLHEAMQAKYPKRSSFEIEPAAKKNMMDQIES